MAPHSITRSAAMSLQRRHLPLRVVGSRILENKMPDQFQLPATTLSRDVIVRLLAPIENTVRRLRDVDLVGELPSAVAINVEWLDRDLARLRAYLTS